MIGSPEGDLCVGLRHRKEDLSVKNGVVTGAGGGPNISIDDCDIIDRSAGGDHETSSSGEDAYEADTTGGGGGVPECNSVVGVTTMGAQ